jgi:hypothetical protein
MVDNKIIIGTNECWEGEDEGKDMAGRVCEKRRTRGRDWHV